MADRPLLLLLLWALAAPALAADPQSMLRELEAQARAANPAFKGFSAERGAAFYRSERPGARGWMSLLARVLPTALGSGVWQEAQATGLPSPPGRSLR